MRHIWKYPVGTDYFSVRMPGGARVLSVDVQDGAVFMWALVDPDDFEEAREFVTFGPAHPLPDDAEDFDFIGTFLLHGGGLVFHLFEVTRDWLPRPQLPLRVPVCHPRATA